MEPDAGLSTDSWAPLPWFTAGWAQSTSEFHLSLPQGPGLLSKNRLQPAHHASHFASLRILHFFSGKLPQVPLGKADHCLLFAQSRHAISLVSSMSIYRVPTVGQAPLGTQL